MDLLTIMKYLYPYPRIKTSIIYTADGVPNPRLQIEARGLLEVHGKKQINATSVESNSVLLLTELS